MMGQRHWQAPDQLRIKKDPAFGYRYIKKADVERRLDEGWEIVPSAVKEKNEGGPVEKAQHYRGLILMRMPKEMIDQRNKHYHDLHERRLRAVARGAHMTSVVSARTADGVETEDGRPLAGTIGAGLTVHQGVHTDAGLTHTDNINIPLDAHPDDLRGDIAVVEEMHAEKTATEKGEGEPSKSAPTKTKAKRR